MSDRAFPVISCRHVDVTAQFYERLGVTRHFQLPPHGELREPGYMPWGERVVYVADPDGNPVALARTPAPERL